MSGRFGASFKTTVELENEAEALLPDGLVRQARMLLCTRRAVLYALLIYLAMYMAISSVACSNDGICLASPSPVFPSTDDAEMHCTTLNITLVGMTREGTFHYADAEPMKINALIWRLTRLTECAFKQQDDPDDDKKRRFTYTADYMNATTTTTTTGIDIDGLMAELLTQYPLNSPPYTVWYYAVPDNWCSYHVRDQTDVNCLSPKPIDTSGFSLSRVAAFFLWLCVCVLAAFMTAMIWIVGFLMYRINISDEYSSQRYTIPRPTRPSHDDEDSFSSV